MNDNRSFAEIRAEFPFPWNWGVIPNSPGIIIVTDQFGKQVPMFTVIRIVQLVTALNNQPTKQE